MYTIVEYTTAHIISTYNFQNPTHLQVFTIFLDALTENSLLLTTFVKVKNADKISNEVDGIINEMNSNGCSYHLNDSLYKSKVDCRHHR